MNDKNTSLTREEFEEKKTKELRQVVEEMKKSRQKIRSLEADIIEKQQYIAEYEQKFGEIRRQLVALQAKVYAGGTV